MKAVVWFQVVTVYEVAIEGKDREDILRKADLLSTSEVIERAFYVGSPFADSYDIEDGEEDNLEG